MEYRIEHDSLGEVKVPADRLWGAQTQRSLENFPIGSDRMPPEIIRAFAVLKKAAALTNCELGRLDERRAALIAQVCDEILDGRHGDEFPLSVWQTGSGTQTNMNCNEVIANRGNALAGEKLLHPNDHVNMSQSSNDTFPTAMHVAALSAVRGALLPAVEDCIAVLRRLEAENEDVIKIGRTHLQDATPLRFSQEISGWRGMLEATRDELTLAAATLAPTWRMPRPKSTLARPRRLDSSTWSMTLPAMVGPTTMRSPATFRRPVQRSAKASTVSLS